VIVEFPKVSMKDVSRAWETVRDGECFFVPLQDTDSGVEKVLSMSYHPRKKPPVAVVGIYRGLWGVLCYRSAAKSAQQRMKQKEKSLFS
jgi:hypothetical protein